MVQRAPRTAPTKKLDRYKRQFFQWYYRYAYTLRQVKELFDQLFADIHRATGEVIEAR